MKKKYWFYFGMGTKNCIMVHKNGIVGCEGKNCPVIDIENSVMVEDGVEDFHVVSFQEVSHNMFLEFQKGLRERMDEEIKEFEEELGDES